MSKNAFLDTPYHLGFAKKKENEPRRHKSRCVHYSSEFCCYSFSKCVGSAHCKYYNESDFSSYYGKITDTYDENIVIKHRQSLINKRIKFFEENDIDEIRKKYNNISYCPICRDLLKNHECDYCGFYIPQKEKTELKKKKSNANMGKVVIKNEKKISKNQITYDVTCGYCDENGICKNSMHGNNLKCHVRSKEHCLFYSISQK